MEDTDTEFIQSLFCRRELSEVDPNFDNSFKDHLIFESLYNDKLLGKVKTLLSILNSIWKIGCSLNGHPNVVHGGLINCLFVESVTTLFKSYHGYYDNNLTNCRVLYLAPTLPNQSVVIIVKLKKIENDQFYYYCQMHTETNKLLCEAHCYLNK